MPLPGRMSYFQMMLRDLMIFFGRFLSPYLISSSWAARAKIKGGWPTVKQIYFNLIRSTKKEGSFSKSPEKGRAMAPLALYLWPPLIQFPITKVKFNKNFHRIDPWISLGILTSRRQKYGLRDIYLKSPNNNNRNVF